MTQMSAKEGIRIHGDGAMEAIIQEWRQLDEQEVMEPMQWNQLTPEQRRKALRCVVCIKQKRSGKLKGRASADGRPQRLYIKKEEATSPTVTTEALLISLAIDAKENRAVATADIPGAFLSAKLEAEVHMMIEGDMVDYLCIANTKYKEYIHVKEYGKKVIYVRLLRALYGLMESAKDYYHKFVRVLKKMGFTNINPYDPCVVNKVIDGTQCTILWHVDDIKVSHHKKAVVDNILRQFAKVFGKLTVCHGDKHEYVGMDIFFPRNGTVEITTPGYVEKLQKLFPEKLNRQRVCPAGAHLFEVNEKCNRLNKEQGEIFHSSVATLLFVGKRSRPDIEPTVAFLTTRVSKSDEDDWKKLKRLLEYLITTKDEKRIMSIDDVSVSKWWIDASYAVHSDMKSQTGAVMKMGRGALYSKATKQKLNSRSSTEAELVAVHDVMPQVLWTRYFLEHQGYKTNTSTVYQDNKSAILLEENGRASSGQRTRHINIRYFFVKDRVLSKEVKIEYCPTNEMIGDFFTKPLTGTKFIEFKKLIMGHD